jgi:heme/copper-type cytochrome/quinol oxidase subunit 2
MSETRTAKRAIQLPLIGVAFLWVMMMLAQFVDLYTPMPQYDDTTGERLAQSIQLQWSVYLILIGITGVAIASLLGQRIALIVREEKDSAMALSAHRFTNLFVILSLVAGAVYAIGNFIGAFNTYDSREASPFVRIVGVYIPIVLATALVVYLILAAFVFRKDAPDISHEEKDEERKKLQRAIGLAYAVPIIGTAIAIIFGLVVYDTTRTTLDVWIWVIIQAIIATSIIIGTGFASKAKSSKPLQPKPKRTGTAAVNLNLVLSIVFGVVVTVMAFTFGFSAIEDLRQWPEWREGMSDAELMPIVSLPSLSWFIESLLPALVLLALSTFGIYRTMTTRNEEKLA